jgi:hypothetical protein
MRKKKENIKINSDPEIPKTEALETEREERYEEVTGEASTEALGPGYTTEPNFESSIDSSDGPLAGDSLEPPFTKQDLLGKAKSTKRRKGKGKGEPHTKTVGRHAAARSSKKY